MATQQPAQHTAASTEAAAGGLPARAQAQTDAARESLEAFGLSPASYDDLIARSRAQEASLRRRGHLMAADRLDGLARVVTEALDAPVSDLAARGRAYLALLDSVLIASFVAEAPGPRWLERLDADLTPAPDDTTSGVLGLHSVARLCAHAGARVVPPPHGPIPVEWQGWRFGIVAAPATAAATHDAAPLADRIPPAVDQLRAARLPGLIVADATREVCPEQRPLRASHPDAGAQELRHRLDAMLQRSRPALAAACDRDHILGVIGAAFMALHIVPSNQVVFLTAHRLMPLVEPGDPRAASLGRFARRFGAI